METANIIRGGKEAAPSGRGAEGLHADSVARAARLRDSRKACSKVALARSRQKVPLQQQHMSTLQPDTDEWRWAQEVWDCHKMSHEIEPADGILCLCSHDIRVADRVRPRGDRSPARRGRGVAAAGPRRVAAIDRVASRRSRASRRGDRVAPRRGDRPRLALAINAA